MNVLDSILDGVREDLAERQREVPLAELGARVAGMPPARDPRPVFRSPVVSIIAEVKRKSPSRARWPISPIRRRWRASTRRAVRRLSAC